MIEESLITHLLATTSVTAIVGNRIYGPDGAQEQGFPRINITRIDTPRVRCFQGPTGVAHPRLQIDCWARTNAEVKNLANKVRLADGGQSGKTLEKFSGTMGTRTVRACVTDDERDLDTEPIEGSAVGPYGVALDVVIWFLEDT